MYEGWSPFVGTNKQQQHFQQQSHKQMMPARGTHNGDDMCTELSHRLCHLQSSQRENWKRLKRFFSLKRHIAHDTSFRCLSPKNPSPQWHVFLSLHWSTTFFIVTLRRVRALRDDDDDSSAVVVTRCSPSCTQFTTATSARRRTTASGSASGTPEPFQSTIVSD